MYFIDEVKIHLKAGDGGDGAVSFRREKFIEFGGPDGGDGGRGGHIMFKTVHNLNTLADFRYRQHFHANNGQRGRGSNCTGASGKDITLEVPIGTEIIADDYETVIADLDKPDQEIIFLKGGRGGIGNAHFKSSTNRAPRHSIDGEKTDEVSVWLKLKLLSDIGIIGMPNAGKSTFLAAVTNAKPKIADYPFTTLQPQLGIARIGDSELVIADIPGLIEGASTGHGLGDRFLKHIERCTILLHLVDATADSPLNNYKTIHQELENYDLNLTQKEEVIALNKADCVPSEDIEIARKAISEYTGKEVFVCSTAQKTGITEIMNRLRQLKYR